MKLATFIAPGETAAQAGEVRGDEIVAFATGTVLERLRSGDRTPADGQVHALTDVQLLEPVPRPPAIFCIGRNYAAHIAELGSERPTKPLVFLKLPLSSTRPSGPVKTPKASQALDYEVELVVVMGPDNAIAGYAVANDVSARDLQRSEAQWSRAKGFDTSCPWGPWITTADEIDPADLRLTTHVNGEPRQDGRTSDLIFKPQELVDFITEACTLEPGAIILTGTPSGVGEAFKPPKYLQPGDSVRVEVEGLGALEHSVR
ncbi:fumarylacetoacetate hydrolase family protein [Solirubrobacter soli]|uniref:fumarylacetoacetate hydrolase family protein n=1 Tax=Solirubrobacter soli TaxID=363832 RepID=UPI000419B4C5|nr:fumarylacetoacetate hydrolase family protein [Solirubrobacter soli]